LYIECYGVGHVSPGEEGCVQYRVSAIVFYLSVQERRGVYRVSAMVWYLSVQERRGVYRGSAMGWYLSVQERNVYRGSAMVC
jgi:hypothetical protein